MKLTKLDLKFIDFMAQWPEHRRVISLKIENSSEILIQSPENWYLVFFRNLGLFAYLVVEVIICSIRKAPADKKSIIAFDTNVNNIEDRKIYFQHNLPEEVVKIVTFHSKFLRLPGLRFTFDTLVKLAGFVMKSIMYQSDLSKEYVRIVRMCLLVHGYLLNSSQPVVYLCHPHRWDTTFQAAYFRERMYYVNLVATPYTPLAVHNKYLIADSIKLGDAYQISEFEVYNQLGTCHHYELWPVARSYALVEHYKGRKVEDNKHILGLYTQGFWLRIHIGKVSETIGQQLAVQEKELIQNLIEYLRNFPDVQLIIFPHPMERSHFRENGEHQFGQLAFNPEVTIDFEGSSSIYDFDRVGLGITTVSSSGFERIDLGFRTIFYIPYISFMDLSISSPFNSLFSKDKEELFEKIDQVRPMSHSDFIHHFFDGSFVPKINNGVNRSDKPD